MSETVICLIAVLGFGALFGFVHLIDRRSKAQERSGRPSLLIRISAIFVGLMAIGAWFEWRLWFALPAAVILLGYGVFGLFGTVKPPAAGGAENTLDAPGNLSPARRNRLTRNMKIGLGCGIASILLVCAGLSCLVYSYLVYVARDTGVLALDAQYPDTVQVGDRFELTLYLKNISDRDISVQNIDLMPALGSEDSILTGAAVVSTNPAMPTLDLPGAERAFGYGRVVRPGETQTVTFYLQADTPGVFDTDVTVYLSDATTGLSDIGITITR